MVQALKDIANPLVSVVIVTRDREDMLQRCIKSILNNTYKNLEIIILDNGSEKSKRLVTDFLSSIKPECECPIRYIESPPKSYVEMRHIVICEAKGEIIMGIDDDCVADKNAISQIVKRFSLDETIGIVGGNIENIGFEGADRFKGRGKLETNCVYETVEDIEQANVFGSANMSIRRKAFDQIGGYDFFFIGGLEDADLCLSMTEKGHRLVFEPSVRITHYHSPSKFRIKGKRSGNILRLYLFFKHFMPQSLHEWLSFLQVELKIATTDIRTSFSHLSSMSGKTAAEDDSGTIRKRKQNYSEYLRGSVKTCRSLTKIVVARIAIPYLIYKAAKARNAKPKLARPSLHWVSQILGNRH